MSPNFSPVSDAQLVFRYPYPVVYVDHKSGSANLRFLQKVILFALIASTIYYAGRYAHSQRYVWFPKRWGTVIPNKIYRSGQLSESIVGKTLVAHNIQVILDLNGKDKYDPEQSEELVAAERLGIPAFHYQLCGDGTGDLNRYANAVELIVKSVAENKKILVHCSAGTKRTGGVIAFYRLLVLKQDPDFVLHELTRYGMKKDPERPLFVYMKNNMRKLAVKLVEKGVIPEVPARLPQLPF